MKDNWRIGMETLIGSSGRRVTIHTVIHDCWEKKNFGKPGGPWAIQGDGYMDCMYCGKHPTMRIKVAYKLLTM
jgi:hypothetical protein